MIIASVIGGLVGLVLGTIIVSFGGALFYYHQANKINNQMSEQNFRREQLNALDAYTARNTMSRADAMEMLAPQNTFNVGLAGYCTPMRYSLTHRVRPELHPSVAVAMVDYINQAYPDADEINIRQRTCELVTRLLPIGYINDFYSRCPEERFTAWLNDWSRRERGEVETQEETLNRISNINVPDVYRDWADTTEKLWAERDLERESIEPLVWDGIPSDEWPKPTIDKEVEHVGESSSITI